MTRSMSLGILVLAAAACGTAVAKEGVSDSTGGEAMPRSTASVVAPASITRLLAFGTRVDASIENGFTSRTDKAGQTVTAAVRSDVKDTRGNVVIPSGSTVTLTIETLDPGNDQIRPEGRLALVVNSVSVNGRSYPVAAELSPVRHQLVGRGITKDEVARVGAGTAIGAVAGQVIGKSTKATVIGGAAGAVVGTAVAAHYAYRDVVVSSGTPITFTLTRALTIASK